MPRYSDFTKHLIASAKYWPTLYRCRADILSQMFCVIGNGYDWDDGRLSDGMRTTKQRERYFAQLEEDSKRNAQLSIERHKQRLEEETDEKTREMLHRFIKVEAYKPRVPRTDAEALAVVNNVGHPDKNREAWAKPYVKREREEGHTIFYPLSDKYSKCFTVPDDVRPDWLVGCGETLDMVIKWDLPANVELAQQAKARLMERFGPQDTWPKRKRNPPPPKVIPPRDIVGRSVRVALPGERSWGEHRPDLGTNVYRSLNQTFANVRLQVPDDYHDPEAIKRNGKPCNLKWGHLFVGTERHYGIVRPKYIIGQDLTPVPDKQSLPSEPVA